MRLALDGVSPKSEYELECCDECLIPAAIEYETGAYSVGKLGHIATVWREIEAGNVVEIPDLDSIQDIGNLPFNLKILIAARKCHDCQNRPVTIVKTRKGNRTEVEIL